MNRLKQLPYYGGLALLVYMPFHIFLSQWLSTFTGGLAVWKVGKDVVTMALVVLSVGLVIRTKAHRGTPYMKLIWLAVAYLAVHIGLYYLNQDTTFGVAALATAYNNRLLGYLIIGMSAALLSPDKVQPGRLAKILVVVSTITCLVALIQYAAPTGLMEHFGYSVERGVKPAFFIDDKPDLPRVMSTVREPNSYGAFLIIPLVLLVAYAMDKRHANKRLMLAGLIGLHGLTLFLTFSRAAWAGAFVGVVTLLMVKGRILLINWLRRFWPVVLLSLVILAGSVYALRDQYVVQNIIFHSDETTKADLDSNELHLAYAESGIAGIVKKPLGYGPGTAGIVSIQDEGKGLLTENYYIQIGHEAGVIGLGLFLTAVILAMHRLFKGKAHLTITLFAAGLGYALMGLVMHLWTNETVAAAWWLSAGLLIGWHCRAIITTRKEESHV